MVEPTSASLAQLKGGAGAAAFVAAAATAQQICVQAPLKSGELYAAQVLPGQAFAAWRAQRRPALGRAPSSGHPAFAGFALWGAAVPSRAVTALLGPCPATPSPGAPSSAQAGAGLDPTHVGSLPEQGFARQEALLPPLRSTALAFTGWRALSRAG